MQRRRFIQSASFLTFASSSLSLFAQDKKENYWQKYLELKADKPHFYPYQAAEQFGISECELLLSNPNATFLGEGFEVVRDLITLRLENLGKVMSIVRNENAVHEKNGIYEKVKLSEKIGLAINIKGLNLRMFPSKWKYVLAVKDTSRKIASHSIQFYDDCGQAVQKVYLTETDKIAEWEKITQEFKQKKPSLAFNKKAIPERQIKTLSAEEKAKFHQEWLELKDIHQFGGIIKRYGIDRICAYEQAPENCAFKLSGQAFENAFNLIKEAGIEVMIFVGNSGLVQIHTAKIHNVKRMGDWLNILDHKEEDFNLHLQDKNITEAWVVRRPTVDGYISCLEGFDKYGQTVLQIFGRRQEGEKEIEKWTEITDKLIVG